MMTVPAAHTTTPAAAPEASPAAGDHARQIAELKSQLREAQKLAALGTVAATLAHEYNNVLTPVVSYAQFALDRDDVPLMRRTLAMVLKQFEAIQHISDRMLGLAGPATADFEAIGVREVVDDALLCLGRDPAKDGVRVVVEIPDDVQVYGNRHQLQQVFFNLFLNARQAMGDHGGTLKVSVTPLSDKQVSIHVRDTGGGIRPEDLSKVFDPFFTTKRSGDPEQRRGMGLGLAVCRDIIVDHHGHLSVESVHGRGTTFVMTLPTAAD